MFTWIFRRLLKSFTGGAVVVENIGEIVRRCLWSWPRTVKRKTNETWNRQVRRAKWSWVRVAVWKAHMATSLEPMVFVKPVDDSRVFGFDFSEAPEVFDGTTVIDAMASGVITGGSGLTFGSVTVISTAFDDIPANGGLKVNISAGVAGTTYDFAMKGTTTAGRVLVIPCRMVVVADYG